MPQHEINEMVIRHDEHLKGINGSIGRVEGELTWLRRWMMAAAVGAVGSLILAVIQLLAERGGP